MFRQIVFLFLRGVQDPTVATDDHVIGYEGIAAQDGRIGVDDDVVADVGMALATLDREAVFIHLEAAGTDGNPLIELDVMAQYGGLADDDAGAVVDAEVFTDGSSGVEVLSRSSSRLVQ